MTSASIPPPSRTSAPDSVGGAPPEFFIIRPSRGWGFTGGREVWRYRELLAFFMWRDIIVRYKQTWLGVAWAVLQPVFTMLVFSVFFGQLGHIPSDGLPYSVFSYCALLPWQLFAYSLTQSGNSLVTNQNLLTKVYFPRVLIPLSATLSGLVDFALAFVVLLLLMAGYGLWPGWAVLTLPLFVVLALLTALGVGLWLSALNVQYRDVRYVLPFLTQFWMFCTPIAYPASLVPNTWRLVYGLNPLVGVVEGFRWALLNKAAPDWGMVAISAAASAAVLVSGVYYFARMERTFADVV